MRGPTVTLFALTTVFFAGWAGIVGYSSLVLGHLRSIPDEETGNFLPPGASGLAIEGQRIFVANGCVYCHSQQVRQSPLTTDLQKELGLRATVPRDYLRFPAAFPGTMRTGPDLTNVGLRKPDANWHHRHLYEPRVVTPWSIMPAFRHLYDLRLIQGQTSQIAVLGLSGPHAPAAGFEVVPTGEALALVAYLLSLQQNYPLPDAPLPAAK